MGTVPFGLPLDVGSRPKMEDGQPRKMGSQGFIYLDPIARTENRKGQFLVSCLFAG